MRPAQALNGQIGAPARLEEIVDAACPVPGVLVGMVGPARPTCLGEDQDVLAPGLKRVCLGGIGTGCAPHDFSAGGIRRIGYDPPAAPGAFSNRIDTEVLDQPVQRASDFR